MQRLIRSFNTLTDELKETLQEQYPDGIDATHIKTIPTAKKDILRMIELHTPDALYLIKINSESRAEIEEFLDQDDSSDAPDSDGGIEEGGDDIGSDDDVDADDDEEEDADEEVAEEDEEEED